MRWLIAAAIVLLVPPALLMLAFFKVASDADDAMGYW